MNSRSGLIRSVVLGALIALAFPAWAHHVFSAEYDADKPVKIKGTLTKVNWVNPHSWIDVEVKDESGKVVKWTIEFGSPNQLTRRGFKKSDLTVGAILDISGYLNKSKADVAIAQNVKLPDGREFYVGADGTGAPEPKATDSKGVEGKPAASANQAGDAVAAK